MAIDQDNLTNKQSDYAVFLPAISSFYSTYVGRQRHENYIDATRMPTGIPDMEMMNWLNPQKGLFPYRWSLYSAGHADLDVSTFNPKEDMTRNRDPNSILLGDSGGFQIAKGVWEGEWKDPNSPEVQKIIKDLTALGKQKRTNAKGKEVEVDLLKEYQAKITAAQKRRETVLKWLDGTSNYAMTLDIPTWTPQVPGSSEKVGIYTYQDAVNATKYNNEYFINNRKGHQEGGTKFLNVLQGANHADADRWYDLMKDYCDPAKYPDTHFDGWAMGGQNMCDVHLVLKRLVALRHDNLLQEGVHDWMHFLGTSKLEWAVLLTDIQRAIRKYVNPAFTISFDCASPFLATANGQVYHHIDLPHDNKWCYRMSPIVDDKKYAADTRPFGPAVIADGLIDHFDESPISQHLQMKDICIYKPGDLNKIGKEGKTSWDSFSYALLMGHNVWMHIEAVQRANRAYDSGSWPAMMWNQNGDHARFKDIVDAIFATPDRAEAEAIIEHYDRYWMDIVGTRGFKGKKAKNARAQFNVLFDVEDINNGITKDEVEFDQTKLDQLEAQ